MKKGVYLIILMVEIISCSSYGETPETIQL